MALPRRLAAVVYGLDGRDEITTVRFSLRHITMNSAHKTPTKMMAMMTVAEVEAARAGQMVHPFSRLIMESV
jgi:hypothetical protein